MARKLEAITIKEAKAIEAEKKKKEEVGELKKEADVETEKKKNAINYVQGSNISARAINPDRPRRSTPRAL